MSGRKWDPPSTKERQLCSLGWLSTSGNWFWSKWEEIETELFSIQRSRNVCTIDPINNLISRHLPLQYTTKAKMERFGVLLCSYTYILVYSVDILECVSGWVVSHFYCPLQKFNYRGVVMFMYIYFSLFSWHFGVCIGMGSKSFLFALSKNLIIQ